MVSAEGKVQAGRGREGAACGPRPLSCFMALKSESAARQGSRAGRRGPHPGVGGSAGSRKCPLRWAAMTAGVQGYQLEPGTGRGRTRGVCPPRGRTRGVCSPRGRSLVHLQPLAGPEQWPGHQERRVQLGQCRSPLHVALPGDQGRGVRTPCGVPAPRLQCGGSEAWSEHCERGTPHSSVLPRPESAGGSRKDVKLCSARAWADAARTPPWPQTEPKLQVHSPVSVSAILFRASV